MFSNTSSISAFDSELYDAIQKEENRQEQHIELIASENYASPRVMEAQGSVLTNKYAEGYPSKRYYGGCEYVDIAEDLAIQRVKELYGADYANVQPHSGSQANTAVFLALLNAGDKILGMSLSDGGHLTHGTSVNFSGKLFDAAQYGANPVGIDDVVTSTTHKTLRGPRGGIILAKENPDLTKKFNSLVFPGTQGGPLMHVIAAKAVAFKEALSPEFKDYQERVIQNAQMMSQTLVDRGYSIVSGGTDNHLVLVSLIDKGLTGKDADAALSRANITVNKNTVPNDPCSPFVTSGLRLGTPAITTRGFGLDETKLMTTWIADILDDLNNEDVINQVKSDVIELCSNFPVYSA